MGTKGNLTKNYLEIWFVFLMENLTEFLIMILIANLVEFLIKNLEILVLFFIKNPIVLGNMFVMFSLDYRLNNFINDFVEN